MKRFNTLDELRAFAHTYNRECYWKRHGYRTSLEAPDHLIR